LHLTRNDADFYDLFGPTKQSRRGNSFGGGYNRALIYDKPRELDFNFDLTYYTNLETLPGFQNVPVPGGETAHAQERADLQPTS